MYKALTELFKRLLWVLPVPVIWLLLVHFGQLTFLNNKAMDWRFRIRGEIDTPVKLIYVDLDSNSFRNYLGERPWPREEFGKIAEILLTIGKAKAIGFDLVFSEYASSILVPKELVDRDITAFAGVTNRHPNIILATAYSEGDTIPLIYKGYNNSQESDPPETPHPRFMQTFGVNQLGLINFDFALSSGDKPRWVPFFTESSQSGFSFTYYQIALQLARTYYGLPPEAIERHKDRIELVGEDGKILLSIPLWEQQMLEVNWFSKFYSEKNLRQSMWEVAKAFALLHKGDEHQKADAEKFFTQFNEAIILIGPTDFLLQDIASTPFDDSPVPKVGVHGNVLKTIFSGLYLKRFSPWITHILLFVLTFVVTLMLTATGRYNAAAKVGGGLILIGYVFLVFWAFNRYHTVIPLIAPIGSAVSASLFGAMIQLLIEEKQKSRIKNMFGTYVSPKIVTQLIESSKEPQLGGHEVEVTAFFSDVESFSCFSEILNPGQLVTLMNEYFTAMTEVLQEEGGSLDKYVGDAIVAMFGTPWPIQDHARRACIASQRIQQMQADLCRKWKSEGARWPEVIFRMRTRIGLNTGLATVGNIGSKRRFNYTMMGDMVNLAALSESAAKTYGVYTMVTQETKLAAEQYGDDCLYRFLDKLRSKGRAQPVNMYEVMGLKKELSDKVFSCADIYNQAIQKYLAQDWNTAISLFEESSLFESWQPSKTSAIETNPSLLWIERCRHCKQNPHPKDWDGVYAMNTK